ncbi:MAG TPA: hypothetical protein VM620_03930 [Hyphomicrobium sp.]|nr:hypothetical protein [Hyphomicrobium sp.]
MASRTQVTSAVTAQTGKRAMWWGQSLEFWQSVILWTMWGGFVLTAVGAALAVVSSFVAYQVSDVTQSEADERIASAGSAALTANAEAAKANEAAAKAQERAAVLEKQAADARLDLEKLRQNMAWRRITPQQHDKLVQALKGEKFRVWVTFVGRDPESSVFREDIAATLKDAGLETVYFSGWAQAVGLAISEQPASPERDKLISAFAAAGLPLVVAKINAMGGEPTPNIVVGTKPPPF